MMHPLLIFLLPFWFARNIKYILFWIYLWQLKQYHRARFRDHFKTGQGKKLIFSPVLIIKVAVLFFAITLGFVFPGYYLLFFPILLFLLYFLESLLYFKSFFGRRTKIPALTAKTALLIFVSLVVTALWPFLISLFVGSIFWFCVLILSFDILLPVVVSLIVVILQPLADYHRRSVQKKAGEKMKSLSDNGKNMTIIAITGSYGKTSTKEYLTDILSSKFKVLSTKEHQNAEIGIAGSILNNLKPEHDIFIVEMGAYDKGKIKEICDFVKPDIGIVTGVNEQHLSLFGSMDNLLSGEGGRELLDCLPKDGLLVVNGENDYCMDLYKKAKIKKISYTVDSNIIKNVKIKTDSVFFAIGNIPFDVNILGRHNLLNFLGAVTVARELGMSFEEIAKASRKINTKNSSFKVWKSEDGFNMIDSTYSANPDGVFADLEYLKLFPGKKVIVMPCLIELGRASKGAHERIGKKIAEICDLAIITSEEFFAEIKNGAASKKMAGEKILFMADTNLIVGKLRSFCRENDSILLEGRISKNIADSLK